MDILHYLNVIIGFSFVMFVLSVVVGAAAQFALAVCRTKAGAVYGGLVNVLRKSWSKCDARDSKSKVTPESVIRSLLDERDSSSESKDGEKSWISFFTGFLLKVPWIKNWVNNGQREIGREELVLLLLQKAADEGNDEVARKLGFPDVAEARAGLKELQKTILECEATEPSFSINIWRTKAISKVGNSSVKEPAAQIFASFDDQMDRVDEKVSFTGKLWSAIAALLILFAAFPVDSIDLITRLANDKVLAKKIADIAAEEKELKSAQEKYSECLEGKAKDSNQEVCQEERELRDALASENLSNLEEQLSLFTPARSRKCALIRFSSAENSNIKANSNSDCRPENLLKAAMQNVSIGTIITWILFSMGSAYWLGVLNKMLGIRSEFASKLEHQRESRATNQSQRESRAASYGVAPPTGSS